MPHPLLTDGTIGIRRRIYNSIRTAKWLRHSDLIFVCGGTDENDMRGRFRRYAAEHLTEYRLILPEHALRQNVGEEAVRYTDLDHFESLLADLSHCVLIFPEAPGSFAELGLFSAKEGIANKTMVVVDQRFQAVDSFISLGPLARYDALSKFRRCLFTDYENPNFGLIKMQLNNRRGGGQNKRRFPEKLNSWPETEKYTKLAVVFSLVDICRFSTLESVSYMAKHLFGGAAAQDEIVELISVLVGSGYCKYIADHQIFSAAANVPSFVEFTNETEVLELRGEIHSLFSEINEYAELFEMVVA